MTYTPTARNAAIIDRASHYVRSVPYQVTARWVFYRLLQEGIYSQKAGYKHLLALLSRARKKFSHGWRPDTLADDTRAALVRGDGFASPQDWLDAIKDQQSCFLDHWATQPMYIECWFEAAAMQAQFDYYANENVPLLAFHGDVSIPEKWNAAQRLADRWYELHKPTTIYYFGDLDPKGLTIPLSAWSDIRLWAVALARQRDMESGREFDHSLTFERVGLNPGDEVTYTLPENPERPDTYQWEALSDDDARDLIGRANNLLDLDAFDAIDTQENDTAERVRRHLDDLEL